MNELLKNIKLLHTTPLGEMRIRRNLGLEERDVIQTIVGFIMDKDAVFDRKGKNWYVSGGEIRITVNAGSYTVITAHRIKNVEKL